MPFKIFWFSNIGIIFCGYSWTSLYTTRLDEIKFFVSAIEGFYCVEMKEYGNAYRYKLDFSYDCISYHNGLFSFLREEYWYLSNLHLLWWWDFMMLKRIPGKFWELHGFLLVIGMMTIFILMWKEYRYDDSNTQ